MDRRRKGYTGTLSEFLRDPCHGVEKIARFNIMWLAFAASRDNILPVCYKDVHRDGVGTLERVAAFLGHSIDRAVIMRSVENNTFDKMQARERAGTYTEVYGEILKPKNADDPNSFKVRRGKVGGFAEELNPEDIDYCNNILHQFRYYRESMRLKSENPVL